MSKDKSTGSHISETIAAIQLVMNNMKEDAGTEQSDPGIFNQLTNMIHDLREVYVVHASSILGLTGEEIGASLGITASRVSQIKSEWLKKKQQSAPTQQS